MPPFEAKDETVTATAPSSPGARAAKSCLCVLWVSPEERLTVVTDGLTVGRGAGADVILPGNGVSRVHARFRRDGPLWLLEDLGSKNGTLVNRMASPLAPIEDQTVVRLGDWVGVACMLPANIGHDSELFREPSPKWIVGVPTLLRLGPIEALAVGDISVVLVGETGTGKEVVAQGLHRLSGRNGRFVALNCAAIPESVAESELFGYRKGAFTGATKDSEGFVSAAAGGTLFLDEIGDLPASIQAKLLRVLEERSVTPLGSTHPCPVDFRLIAATQEPLSALVEEGTFRGDLHARVSAAEVRLPPLRQRREDVLRLYRHAASGLPAAAKTLSAPFVEALCAYDWPFNVRELVQLVRLLSISEKGTLLAEDLPERFWTQVVRPSNGPPTEPARTSGAPGRREAWMLRHARELASLKAALDTTGNVSLAARKAGIPRYRALRLLAVEAELARST